MLKQLKRFIIWKLLIVGNCLTFVPLPLAGQKIEIKTVKKIWPKIWRFLSNLKELLIDLQSNPSCKEENNIDILSWMKNLKGIYGVSGRSQECNIWFNNGWKNEITPFTGFKALKSESCFLSYSYIWTF